VRIRARMGYDSLSTNVLELFDMLRTAFVVTVIRKDLPKREENAVFMRGDNSSAVQWVLNCKGRIDDVRAGGLMRIPGALEIEEKWYFQAKHVAGVDNSLADMINRC